MKAKIKTIVIVVCVIVGLCHISAFSNPRPKSVRNAYTFDELMSEVYTQKDLVEYMNTYYSNDELIHLIGSEAIFEIIDQEFTIYDLSNNCSSIDAEIAEISSNSYYEGVKDGYEEGYNKGYEIGYAEGCAVNAP